MAELSWPLSLDRARFGADSSAALDEAQRGVYAMVDGLYVRVRPMSVLLEWLEVKWNHRFGAHDTAQTDSAAAAHVAIAVRRCIVMASYGREAADCDHQKTRR